MTGENTKAYLYELMNFPHLVSFFCEALNQEHKIITPIINHKSVKMMSDKVLCKDHPYMIS